MLSQLAAHKGWALDVAMLMLIAAAVLVTHMLFRLGERLTRTRDHSAERKA